jgi:flagellar basal-body rod protein FlgC
MNPSTTLRNLVVLIMLFVSPIMAQTLDDSLRISMSGVMAQRVKLTIVAQNIANVMSLKDEETGLPYQKRYAVLEPSPDGVRVASVELSTAPFAKYFDPAANQTDELGFFYYPNVNLPTEMMVLNYTEAIYDANVNVFKVSKAMYQTTLEILK